MSSYDFDLIVIGSGPAGEKGAAQAAFFGKKVALIERETVPGGACVNTGTLPSKTLRESALYLSGFRQRGLHGVTAKLERQATVSDLLYREERVLEAEHKRIDLNLTHHDVTRIAGEASFIDPHTVAVRRPGWPEQRVSAAFFLVATGSSPHRPELYPFDHARVYDSDEIVRVEFIPKTMAVIGGGVIGCEYACIFATLGVEVTLLESRPSLLPFIDGQMSQLLVERMRRLGLTVRLGTSVEKVELLSRGVGLTLSSKDELDTEMVLVAAGRQANTSSLRIENAGLKAGKRGLLEVNPWYRTAVDHIFAAGDVIGFPALASTSMEQARVAVVHMFEEGYKTEVSALLPYGIYTIPEVSMAGETEEALKEKGIAYVAGMASFADNARGKIIGEDGCLKLLFRKGDYRLLGVHALGEGATELVHVGLAAMHLQASAELFIQMCFNYPTLSEAYKYATYDALQKARA